MTNQNQSGSGTQTGRSDQSKSQQSAQDQVNPATGQKWQESDEGYQDFIKSQEQNQDQDSDTTGTGGNTGSQGGTQNRSEDRSR